MPFERRCSLACVPFTTDLKKQNENLNVSEEITAGEFIHKSSLGKAQVEEGRTV